MQVSILYAFVAGIISFLSPCVLPLVPGYVSMLSGIGVEQLRAGSRRATVCSPPRWPLSRVLGGFREFWGLSERRRPISCAEQVADGAHRRRGRRSVRASLGWMADQDSRTAGLVIGGVLAFAAAIFGAGQERKPWGRRGYSGPYNSFPWR